jgi:hypothetical protein
VSDKSKKYAFFGFAIPAVFNISDGNNISSVMGEKQKIETAAVQLKYSTSFGQKLKIFFRRPKFFLKNFMQIKNSIKAL